MSAGQVIRHFEDRETLPIDLEEVVAEIMNHSEVEEVYWFSADIDPEIVRGFIVAWQYPNEWRYTSDPSGVYIAKCADIYYSVNDSPEWQRFASCKEAFHLIDRQSHLIMTPDQVSELVDKVILPPELQDPFSDGAGVNRDRGAELMAVAALLPMAARNLLLPKYQSGALSATDIARLADIPVRYISLVMSPKWDGIYSVLRTID